MIKFKEAEHYKILQNKKVSCMLCPHNCILGNGELGKCNVRLNIDGKLKALAFSKPHSVKYSKISDIPFYHYMPKEETLVVGTLGDNLLSFGQTNPFFGKNIHEVKLLNQNAKQIKKQISKTKTNLITFKENEPLISYEYLKSVAKENNKKLAIVTNGFIEEAPLVELIPYIEAVLIEVKSMDEGLYENILGGKLSPVLKTIKLLHDHNVWVEVRMDLIVDEKSGSELYEARKLISWMLNNLNPNVPLHLGIFQKNIDKRIVNDSLIKARKMALDAGMNYIYLHDSVIPGINSTICPNCKREVVRREDDSITLNMTQNKCLCGKEIAGIWQR